MNVEVIVGDSRAALAHLPAESVQVVVTSPPYYGLRDYGVEGQIGLEQTPEEYVAELVAVFREVRRVLRHDGTLWLNIGDSYANDGKWGGKTGGKHAKALHGNSAVGRQKRKTGLKPKDLIGIPWMLAFALRADGWFLRQDIIWHKPNPMPESTRDRCTKSHEYLFLLSKSPIYYYDEEAIAEPAIYGPDSGKTEAPKGSFEGSRPAGRDRFLESSFRAIRPTRNKWSVWTASPARFDLEMCVSCEAIYGKDDHRRLRREKVQVEKGVERRVYCRCGAHDAWLSHFATFPPDLIEPCILAGTSAKGCCPSCGTGLVRKVERTAMVITRSDRGHSRGHTRSSGTMVQPPKRKTVGWQLPCKCEAGPPVPCVVLDPFGGVGTTALVADRLQRAACLVEINPHYAAIARFRIARDRGGGLLDQMDAAE